MINLGRARTVMEQEGVDCIIASSIQNVSYITNFRSFLKQVTPSTLVFGVFCDPRSPVIKLVAPHAEADWVVCSGIRAEDVKLYGTFPLKFSNENLQPAERKLYTLSLHERLPQATSTLASLIKDLGMDCATIALDESGLPYGTYEQIKSLLPRAKVIPGSRILNVIRMVKTDEEIQRLNKVVSLTEKALKKSARLIKPGRTTLEIAREIERIECEESAKPIFTVVASGKYRAFPNAPPSNDRLSTSDIVRFDVGCSLSGYCSDLGRTVSLGRVDRKIREYYDAILHGLEVATDHAVPGVRASEIFEIATKTVAKSGIKGYQRHHTGHGIGLDVYDLPLISASDSTVLEEGMVLNLETPYYELGFSGLIVEDCMVVRKKHPKVLSRLSRELDGF